MNRSTPIGVFDSGVGGLTVLRAIRRELPAENAIYFADQAHVPYGGRQIAEIQDYSERITAFLLQHGCKLIVVACNTASAAALKYLRDRFAGVPFVGMEPAVKPAVARTKTGKIGVLATPATFQGELYASIVGRFAAGITLHQSSCPGLVTQVERGDLESPRTHAILAEALLPMLSAGIDTVVLGCTHYPFAIPQIRRIVGPGVEVIDPAPAVARQVSRLLTSRSLRSIDGGQGEFEFFSSGPPARLQGLLPRLLGEPAAVGSVEWGPRGELKEPSQVVSVP